MQVPVVGRVLTAAEQQAFPGLELPRGEGPASALALPVGELPAAQIHGMIGDVSDLHPVAVAVGGVKARGVFKAGDLGDHKRPCGQALALLPGLVLPGGVGPARGGIEALGKAPVRVADEGAVRLGTASYPLGDLPVRAAQEKRLPLGERKVAVQFAFAAVLPVGVDEQIPAAL